MHIYVEWGEPFTPAWGGNPPGLGPGDNDIWHMYRQITLNVPGQLFFNVRLMGDLPLPDNTPDKIARMAQLNAALRVDVIKFRATEIDVIELRMRAGLSSIGQLLGYTYILQESQKFTLPVNKILVTDAINPLVKEVTLRYDITMVGV